MEVLRKDRRNSENWDGKTKINVESQNSLEIVVICKIQSIEFENLNTNREISESEARQQDHEAHRRIPGIRGTSATGFERIGCKD